MRSVRMAKQQGATLAEFTMVVIAVLAPVLFLTGMMGKQIDAKHDYEQALRYAAWERTVWFAQQPRHRPPSTTLPVKSEAEFGNEIQARVLADRKAKIKATQRNGQQPEVLDPMLYHQDRQTRNYAVRLKEPQNMPNGKYVKNAQVNQAMPGTAARGVDTVIDGLKAVTSFDVQTNGLYRTRVTMDLADIDWLKEFKDSQNRPLDLRVDRSVQGGVSNKERQLMLLADGWNLGGRRSTISQVQSLVPVSFLQNDAIRTAQSIISFVPWAKELGPSYLELGKVDPDPVPTHRLGNYPR